VLQVLDAAAIRRWADVSVDLLESHRAELDRANVFPVADRDTGTNLTLTLRAAAEALSRVSEPGSAAEAAAVLAGGALRGARGNSGVIISQLPRGLAEVLEPDRAAGVDGALLAAALHRADELARAAVSRPMEGTVLSVLRAAAGSAASAGSRAELAEVVTAAARGASIALADTPRQLPVLARAGVVDAGGRGLVLLLEALVTVVTGRPASEVESGYECHRAVMGVGEPGSLAGRREVGSAGFDYEVMYLLEDSSASRVSALRARLDELGDSVAVVGDGQPDTDGVWHVHVHCDDIGAAIEAGVEAGRPRRITVMRFADRADERDRAIQDTERFSRERAVVTVVSSKPVAELVELDGVVALVAGPERAPVAEEIAAAAAGTRARHVVLLPNDVELTPVAEEAADQVRNGGAEVVVVPTSSVLQGLAALAVHDSERRAGDDVVAMAEAAAATRTGVVQIATGEALTWVGRCYAGDVLGLVDGEVVLIEQDLVAAACQLADRMLTTGGELVTVLLGEAGEAEEGGQAADPLGELLTAHLRHTHPEVEVVLYSGGQANRPLQLGVE
jgi:DAK2 domain fusion protein YloV